MDLEERFLEGVFRDLAVAAEAVEESEEIPLMPLDEDAEGGFIAGAVGVEELFVCEFAHSSPFGWRGGTVMVALFTPLGAPQMVL